MKIIQTKMRFQPIELSPEFAQQLLDKNHPQNRKPKTRRIEQYCDDMRNGYWTLTWEPIVQDEDGYTVEGQNRLAAFIRSGLDSIPVILCTGAPRKAMLGAGTGTPRNVADVARITGHPFPHGAATFGAIARRMALGLERNKNRLSIPETLQFVQRHTRALEFVFEAFGTKMRRGITQAPVLAVVARAYYQRGFKERLKEFAKVLIDGIPGNVKTDSAAIRLRNFLLENMGGRPRKSPGSYKSAKVIYAKAEIACRHFLDFEDIQSLRETTEELFQIPDDPQDIEEDDLQVAGKVG